MSIWSRFKNKFAKSPQTESDSNDSTVRPIDSLLRPLISGDITDPSEVVERARTALALLSGQGTTLSNEDLSALFSISSLLTNAGGSLNHRETIEEGIRVAQQVAESSRERIPVLHSQATYNQATGLAYLFDFAARAESDGSEADFKRVHNRPSFRLEKAETLRQVRVTYREAADDPAAPGMTRGASLCNLANELDSSARWVEAYDCYVDALAADPDNGNASGNAAILLASLIHTGFERPGHLASLYDHYLAHAKAHHGDVVRIAGQETADRYDAMQLQGVPYHVHEGSLDDSFTRWIVSNRLALTAALEGLGSDSERWDDAHVRNVVSSTNASGPPTIFAMANVLKGEYVVARRLAFTAIEMLTDVPGEQHEDDKGAYVDTLDASYYGLAPQQLVLAHRSVLDVLDKIAVAVNEYMQVGDTPTNIYFKTFWQKGVSPGHVRPELVGAHPECRPIYALAELAVDVSKTGLYHHAADLRNAGTHRFVIAALAGQFGIGQDAISHIGLGDLIESTIEALKVVRAAYLYLLDLVASVEKDKPVAGGIMPLTDQH